MNFSEIITQNIQVARSKLLEKANQKMVAENSLFQGLLFVGNKHETVPLRLLTDKYLTPRAKTAWQLIKLHAYQQFQGTAFPSYDELALWLSDRAFQGKPLSRKVVSQTLLLLRLTRWLTLCETIRSETGQILGNVYIMNDEPLSITDCVQLNDDYLRLLQKSAKHKDPLVKDVATAIIDDMLREDSHLLHAVSHIDVIRARYQQMQNSLTINTGLQAVDLPENLTNAIEGTQQKLLGSMLSSNMELSKNGRELSQKIDKLPSSNMELSLGTEDKSLISDLVPIWNSAAQYSTSTNISTKYSTVPQDELLVGLPLSTGEKQQLVEALNGLDNEMQKAVLFEAKSRIAGGSVQKPLGYLLSMIRRAKNGDFKPYLLNKAQNDASAMKSASANRATNRNFLPNRTSAGTGTTGQMSQQQKLDMLSQFTRMVHRG